MNRLKDLRQEKNLSQKDISNILGVANNSYSRYESEIINISINKLRILANYYNVSMDYIFFRTDNRDAYKKSVFNYSNKNRLKELRNSAGKTQKLVASQLNMPFRTYIKYENMTRPLNHLLLNTFADYYDTSIDYVIYNTDDIKAHDKSIVDWKIR